MARYLLRRVAYMVMLLILLSFVVFVIISCRRATT